MDWHAFETDLLRFRAHVARWELRAYVAIITAAITTIGFTALAGALTTVPA